MEHRHWKLVSPRVRLPETREKFQFAQEDVEIVRSEFIQEGYKPLKKIIEAIKNLQVSTHMYLRREIMVGRVKIVVCPQEPIIIFICTSTHHGTTLQPPMC